MGDLVMIVVPVAGIALVLGFALGRLTEGVVTNIHKASAEFWQKQAGIWQKNTERIVADAEKNRKFWHEAIDFWKREALRLMKDQEWKP